MAFILYTILKFVNTRHIAYVLIFKPAIHLSHAAEYSIQTCACREPASIAVSYFIGGRVSFSSRYLLSEIGTKDYYNSAPHVAITAMQQARPMQ